MPVIMCLLQHACGGQRTTWEKNLFIPFTMWIPSTELGL